MYKPSEQALNLLEILRVSPYQLRILDVCRGNYAVSQGYFEPNGRWFHQHQVGAYWPSSLVEALTRAGLIDHNGRITEEGKVAHLPPSSRSFNKAETRDDKDGKSLGLLPAAIAAYAWYFESARKAGETPFSFRKWRKCVTDEQVRDMVRLYRLPVE